MIYNNLSPGKRLGIWISTVYVLSVSKKKKPMVSTYTLHSVQIQQVNKAELYLCVELYYDLTWSKHISNITTKVKKKPTPAFAHCNPCNCPHQEKNKCYKTLVHPIQEYSSLV